MHASPFFKCFQLKISMIYSDATVITIQDNEEDLEAQYDLEAQAYVTVQKMQKMNGETGDVGKQRLWRWALRGIVIQ